MGDQGTLDISESAGRGSIYRESWVDKAEWEQWVEKGYVTEPEAPAPKKDDDTEAVLDVREGGYSVAEYKIPVTMNVPYHQPHLVNFFDAIRGKGKLNCPAEIGYETAVTVLKVNEAVTASCRQEFKPDDFHVAQG
jgi:hypothetical protein